MSPAYFVVIGSPVMESDEPQFNFVSASICRAKACRSAKVRVCPGGRYVQTVTSSGSGVPNILRYGLYPVELDAPGFTVSSISLVHRWKRLAELKCDAFAHHTFGVDGVNQSIHLRGQQIALHNFDHFSNTRCI